MKAILQGQQKKIPLVSNPNLLINWDFRNPVNRNEKTEYNGNASFIDCWKSTNSNISCVLLSDGIRLSVEDSAEGNGYLRQIFRNSLIPNVTYTYSALVKGTGVGFMNVTDQNEGTFFGPNAIIDNPGETWTLITNKYTPTDKQNINMAYFRCDKGYSYEIKACKLELGDTQTLAYQDTDGEWQLIDPPDYDTQYALCSQYSPTTGKWCGYAFSNPNLLDNWYFVDPINQRGQTEYSGRFYGIDRWFNRNITSTIEDDGLKLAGNQSTYTAFNQSIENYKQLIGKTVTLSVLVKDNNITTGGIALALFYAAGANLNTQGFAETSIPPGENGLFSVTGTVGYAVDEIYTHMNFGLYFGNTQGSMKIVAAKLELGSTQTLAHQDVDGNWILNDPPPNKALELAKCQRYQIINRMTSAYLCTINSTTHDSSLPIPATLRTAPTIVGTPRIYLVSNNQELEEGEGTITVRRIDANAIILRVSNVAEPCAVYFPTGTGLDANL